MTATLNPFMDQILTKTDRDAHHHVETHAHSSSDTPKSSAKKSFFKTLAETGEGEMARNRLVISGLILIYFLFEVAWNGRDLTLPLFVITSFFLFSLALAFHIISSPAANYRRRILAMCGDIGTLSIGLNIGAEITASTFPIYLWIIFGNGFRFGLLFLTLSSFAATACFAVVLLTTSYWQSLYNLSFGLLIALIVVPLYSRKLIRDLSDARKNAETASEMKSLFLASVSHELRTPLNAIIGLSDLLSSTHLNEDQREMSTSINASGRSLCGLVDNFLDYSRLEAGAMPTNKAAFCLVSLMTELNGIGHAQARDKDLIVGLHVTPRTPADLIGDRGKLAQILTNLIGNAVKFTERGSISLGVDALSNDGSNVRLRFEVTDTGIGISPTSQKHIFQRFTQADNRIVDQYGGTGLGLAIVQELVELLGGQIGVTSTPDEGSTFWCEFDMPIAVNAVKPTPPQQLKIAIFSDNAHNRNAIKIATGYDHVEILENTTQVASWLDHHHKNSTGSVLIVNDTLHDPNLIYSFAKQSTNVKVICVSETDEQQLPNPTIKATSFSQVRLRAIDVELEAMIKWLGYHRAIRQEKGTLMAPNKDTRKLSILVAEDNHANQMVVRKILTHAGHNPVMANDGEEALEELSQQNFDVILLDLNMPRMNGFEALKFMHFSLHDQDIPIIALTADASMDTNKKCLDAGFDACITKPYNPNTLLQTIQKFTSSVPETCRPQPQRSDLEKESEPVHSACKNPANETSQDSLKSIDLDRVKTLAKLGDTKFFNDLINEFDSEALEILSQLRMATDAHDLENIRTLAHALKSSAINFGAMNIVQKCELLEYGDRQDILSSAAAAVADLRTDYEEVRSALITLAMSHCDTTRNLSSQVSH